MSRRAAAWVKRSGDDIYRTYVHKSIYSTFVKHTRFYYAIIKHSPEGQKTHLLCADLYVRTRTSAFFAFPQFPYRPSLSSFSSFESHFSLLLLDPPQSYSLRSTIVYTFFSRKYVTFCLQWYLIKNVRRARVYALLPASQPAHASNTKSRRRRINNDDTSRQHALQGLTACGTVLEAFANNSPFLCRSVLNKVGVLNETPCNTQGRNHVSTRP